MDLEDYKIEEHRPGKFVVVVNEEVVRPATKADLKFYKALEQSKRVDIEIVLVSTIISVCAAMIAFMDIELVYRLLAAIAFGLSILSTAGLFIMYLVKKIPKTMLGVYESGDWSLVSALWLFKRWIKLFFSSLGSMEPEKELEFGYLNLWVSFLLIALIVFIRLIFVLGGQIIEQFS